MLIRKFMKPRNEHKCDLRTVLFPHCSHINFFCMNPHYRIAKLPQNKNLLTCISYPRNSRRTSGEMSWNELNGPKGQLLQLPILREYIFIDLVCFRNSYQCKFHSPKHKTTLSKTTQICDQNICKRNKTMRSNNWKWSKRISSWSL